MACSGVARYVEPRKEKHVETRLPSLDGLRAVSIVLVLLAHLSRTRGLGRIDLGIGQCGHLGVVVFFVISGFLITSLLISEEDRSGSVSLRLFYARRALRIFPASFAYIACVLVLSGAGLFRLQAPDLWHAVTYTVNYQVNPSWQVSHLWSLSVEEQFYLLWPFAFAALGSRRAVWLSASVVAISPLARAFSHYSLAGTPYQQLQMFPMVSDSLATGCVLALLRTSLEQSRWYRRLFHPVWSMLILVFILAVNRYDYTPAGEILGLSAVNVGAAILLHRAVSRPADGVGRVLNWAPVAFVGTLSYSLYLWQQVFLNRSSTAWVNAFPQNLVLTIVAAQLSFYLLEQPLLKLRRRLGASTGPAATGARSAHVTENRAHC